MCDAGKMEIFNATSKFEKKVATSGPNSSFAASSASEISVKIPKLDLPSFSGRYTEWMSFIDLFTASVDSNTTLPVAQKPQDLKTSVNEEPHRLISSLTITNTNNSAALNILRKRYEKKGYRSRTYSLYRKFQRNQKREPCAIEKVDRNNGQKCFTILALAPNLGILSQFT